MLQVGHNAYSVHTYGPPEQHDQPQGLGLPQARQDFPLSVTRCPLVYANNSLPQGGFAAETIN